MTDVAAFLKDRLDELQWVAESVTADTAQDWDPPVWVQDDNYKHNTLIVDKTWLFADVAAKRQIIDEHANGWEGWEDPPTQEDIESAYCVRCEDRDRHDAMRWPCRTLKLLALPYADHEGFDEAWKA